METANKRRSKKFLHYQLLLAGLILALALPFFTVSGASASNQPSTNNHNSSTQNFQDNLTTSENNFSQVAELTVPGLTKNDEFGGEVSLSTDGHTALIGSFDLASNTIAAYVFSNESGSWKLVQKLGGSLISSNYAPSIAISLSGDGHTAAIGNSGEANRTGAVYIYSDNTGNWSLVQKLTLTNGAAQDTFGANVNLSNNGQIIAVGAYGSNNGAGAAYIYSNTNGNWSLLKTLTAPDSDVRSFESESLSADGNTLLAVARPEATSDTPPTNVARDYIFKNIGGNWSQVAKLDIPTPANTSTYASGQGVLSGDGHTAIITANGNNGFVGEVHIYNDKSGTWSQIQEFNSTVQEYAGTSASLSNDGSKIFFGAFGADNDTGRVYIYGYNNGTWSQTSPLTSADKTTGEQFGYSVASSADGQTVLVGAVSKNNTGSVYVFTSASTSQCQYFPETKHSACGRFLDYWKSHGGLAQQGYPISDEFTETNAAPPAGDGKAHTVQYFQRARFEYHPENQPPYDVELGLLGSEQFTAKYPNGTPVQQEVQHPMGTCQHFDATNLDVCGVFLTYWQQHGGLAQQGYPISDTFLETNAPPPAGDGQQHVVQYFQRARFELHGNDLVVSNVELGLLGSEQFGAKYPNGTPKALTLINKGN